MKNLHAQLEWDTTAKEAFIKLKHALAQAADLATPDYAMNDYANGEKGKRSPFTLIQTMAFLLSITNYLSGKEQVL